MSKIYSIVIVISKQYYFQEVPGNDKLLITQALETGCQSIWTIIMIGGGYFASAVFSGKPYTDINLIHVL